MKKITYLLLAIVVCSSSAYAQKKNSSSKTNTRTEQTLNLPNNAELVANAKAGNARAQMLVADCYLNGTNGVKKNYKEAVKWYRLAAEQGLAVAQYNLAFCYYNGYGVSQSYAEAVKWYRLAAEQGDATAQFNLGVCYYIGKGVAKNRATAIRWWKKAAAQGDSKAQGALRKLGVYD